MPRYRRAKPQVAVEAPKEEIKTECSGECPCHAAQQDQEVLTTTVGTSVVVNVESNEEAEHLPEEVEAVEVKPKSIPLSERESFIAKTVKKVKPKKKTS
jgi:hypothetical protein